MEVAFIKAGEVFHSPNHTYQLIRVGTDLEIIQSKQMQHVIHAVHDCKRAQCRVVVRGASSNMHLQHSAQNVFIYNKFRLSKLADKLPV
jgi:UDP-N-acetylenolpyruvoylglucosamine reductase